jgi:hypothetical protein
MEQSGKREGDASRRRGYDFMIEGSSAIVLCVMMRKKMFGNGSCRVSVESL